jgi:hypothetical protein
MVRGRLSIRQSPTRRTQPALSCEGVFNAAEKLRAKEREDRAATRKEGEENDNKSPSVKHTAGVGAEDTDGENSGGGWTTVVEAT